MEKSINIHRALRTTLRLLLTSILSIVFGAVSVVVGNRRRRAPHLLGNSSLRAYPRKYSRPYSLDIHPININQDENKTQ